MYKSTLIAMNYRLHTLLSRLSESDNNIAKVILDNYDKFLRSEYGLSAMTVLIDNPALPSPVASITDPELRDDWYDKDLRISHLLLKGFRSIPNDKFYGIKFICPSNYIDFYDANTSASLILLGANGCGKTSLYSALELMCLGKTAIAQKHKIKDANLGKFYSNFGQSSIPFEIEIVLRCGIYNIRGVNRSEIAQHINLENFFCSESDIAEFECSGEDIERYVLFQIGLSDVLQIIDMLNSYIGEINDKESTNEDVGEASRLDELKNKANNVKTELESLRNEIRSDVLSEAQSILESLTKDYIDDDPNIKLGFSEINNRHIFNGKLKKGNDTLDPRYYFNNFRFKLYLISIRIAIAFYIMESRNVRFPLLFDDIFDSSDFENRLSSKKFFKKILDYYNRRFAGEPPLQILFFTQDEVIGESVYEAIAESAAQDTNNSLIEGNVILGRLYLPGEADEKDKVNVEVKKLSKEENIQEEEEARSEKIYNNLYDVITSE